jgi:hypothetical protein
MKTLMIITIAFLSLSTLFLKAASAQGEGTINSEAIAINNRTTMESPNFTRVEPQAPAFVPGHSKALHLNYSLPAFTYSAEMVITDFTGRTLKAFKINPHDCNNFDFNIADMLAGQYQYTLILDNQKSVTGEFTLAD